MIKEPVSFKPDRKKANTLLQREGRDRIIEVGCLKGGPTTKETFVKGLTFPT
jgi:hypothetical protein